MCFICLLVFFLLVFSEATAADALLEMQNATISSEATAADALLEMQNATTIVFHQTTKRYSFSEIYCRVFGVQD